MIYLITQIIALLAVASIISGIIGWVLRQIKAARAESLLRQRLRRSEQSIPPIKDALAQAHDDLDRQDSDIAALQRELDDRESRIDDAERRQRELQRQMQLNRDAVAETEAERNRLQADLEALHSAQQSAASTNGNLEDIIASLNNDLQQKEASRLQQAEHNAELDAQINALTAQLEEATRNSDNLDASLRNEQGQHVTTKQAVRDAQARLQALDKKLAEAASERDRLQAQSAERQQEIDELKQQVSDLQKAAVQASSDADQKLAKLEHKLDKERALAAQAERQQQSDAAHSQRLQQDLDRALGEMKNAFAKHDGDNAQLKDELERQKLAAVEANTARAENERKYDDLKRDHDALKKEHHSAQQALSASKADTAAMREKSDANKREMAELEKSLQAQLNAGDQSRLQLQSQIDGLQAELKQRKDELREAVGNERDLSQQISDYQSLEGELRGRISQLEMLLQEARKAAGKTMLGRIVELETMLDAERRKAENLPEFPEMAEVKVRAQVQHAESANAEAIEKKSA